MNCRPLVKNKKNKNELGTCNRVIVVVIYTGSSFAKNVESVAPTYCIKCVKG